MTVNIPSTLVRIVSVITFGTFFNAYISDHKEDRTVLDNIHTNVVSFIRDIM